MQLHDLKAGDRVRTIDGNIAEVLAPTEDGRWIKVRYIESAGDPALVGTEDLCSEEEIEDRASREAHPSNRR
jgi:hypothetical protein